MKYRISHVTNSSSSSYICEICGYDVSGMNMCLSEADMAECENGHIICRDHVDEEAIQLALKTEQESDDEDYYDDEWCYSFPAKCCPICNLEHISADVKLAYVLKKYGIDANEVDLSIHDGFNTLRDLKAYNKTE